VENKKYIMYCLKVETWFAVQLPEVQLAANGAGTQTLPDLLIQVSIDNCQV